MEATKTKKRGILSRVSMRRIGLKQNKESHAAGQSGPALGRHNQENISPTTSDLSGKRKVGVVEPLQHQKKRRVFQDVYNKRPLDVKTAIIQPTKIRLPTVKEGKEPTKEEKSKPRSKSKVPTSKTKRKTHSSLPDIPIPQPVTGAQQEQVWDCTTLTKEIESMLAKLPARVSDIDVYSDNCFWCAEYANDIMAFLQHKELKYCIPPGFMDKDPEVKPHMRTILVDWLIQVQCHLHMELETLHLGVAMLDQYLHRKRIAMTNVQLLGVTCLLIASKFVERFPPKIDSLIHLTDNTYNMGEVVWMERCVLQVLEYQIHLPVAPVFLDRYLQVLGEDREQNTKFVCLCQYLLDLALTDVQCVAFRPSMQAAASVCLARTIFLDVGENPHSHRMDTEEGSMEQDEGSMEQDAGKEEVWTPSLNYYSRYTHSDLKQCIYRFARQLLRAEKSKHQGARSKYNHRSNFAVSSWSALRTCSALQTLVPDFEPETAE